MGGNGTRLSGINKNKNKKGVNFKFPEFEKETKDMNLKNRGNFKTEKQKFWYGETTDHIERKLIYKNYKHLEKINNFFKKTYSLDIPKNTKLLTFHVSNDATENHIAYYVSNSIVFNYKYFRNYKGVEKLVADNIKRNFFPKTTKDNYVNNIITHEYGHFIFDKEIKKRLEQKKLKSNNLNIEKQEKLIVQEILTLRNKIYNKRSSKKNNFISEYGTYNPGDWLAEVFVSLNNNKINKKNELAYSMHQWFLNKKEIKK